MLNRESGDRIELFYEIRREATIRATVNCLLRSERKIGPCMNSKNVQFAENGTEVVRLFARFALTELPFYPLWLIVLAYGGHMEQRTSPGEISLISWNTRAR